MSIRYAPLPMRVKSILDKCRFNYNLYRSTSISTTDLSNYRTAYTLGALSEPMLKSSYVNSLLATTANYDNVLELINGNINYEVNSPTTVQEGVEERIASTVYIVNTSRASAAIKEAIKNSFDANEKLTYVANAAGVLIQSVNHSVRCYVLKDHVYGRELTILLTNIYNQEFVNNAGLAVAIANKYTLPDAVLEAVLLNDSNAFIAAIQPYIIAQQEKEKERYANNVITFAKARFNSVPKLAQFKRVAEEYHARIRETEEKLTLLYQKLEENNYNAMRYTAWEERDKPINEFIEFLETTKNSIIHSELYDSFVAIVIKTPLLYWEAKYYDILYKNRKQGNALKSFSETQMLLLNKIFLTKELTLNLATGISIMLRDNRLEVARYRNSIPQPYMPNPHIDAYDCWGDNRDLIRSCITNGDYVGMWAQIISTLGGIDFSDSAVTDRFFNIFRDVLNANQNNGYYPIKTQPDTLVKKDGTLISIADALAECEVEQ